MENFEMILMSGLGAFVQLFIVGICIYYVAKKASVEAWLLLVSSLVSFFLRLFYMILVPVLFDNEIIDPGTWSTIAPFFSLISVLADIMFGIGFLMLVNKLLRVTVR